jgi:hypothetical protein
MTLCLNLTDCRYAKCTFIIVIMLSFDILSVAMLRVIVVGIVLLSGVMMSLFGV